MRNWIDIVTRKPLTEASVLNVKAVDNVCNSYASEVTTPESKAWFTKKLRAYVLNDPKSLTKLDDQVLADYAKDPRFPWLQAAIDRGEPVYNYGLGKNVKLWEQVDHIVDFFKSLEESAQYHGDVAVQTEDARLAQKALSKLPKMDLDQVLAASEVWFKRKGTRVMHASKAGAETVYTWADGFYAVRYTTKDTMMRDGADLQNCLATGTYWNEVESGKQAVYGIRNPTHEAIVGIRVQVQPTIVLYECKGKNNQPPIPDYVPYCKEFLDFLGANNTTHDTQRMGLFAGKRGYGTFEEVAEPEMIAGFNVLVVDYMVKISYKGKVIVDHDDTPPLLFRTPLIAEVPKADLIKLFNGLVKRGYSITATTQATDTPRLKDTIHSLLKLGIYTHGAGQDERNQVFGSLKQVATIKKTPFGEVILASDTAFCTVGSKKVICPLKSAYGYRSTGDSLNSFKAELPRNITQQLSSEQLAEILNRFRHLGIKNEIEYPNLFGLALVKVGAKKLYKPYVDELKKIGTDKDNKATIYAFPKEGQLEKFVVNSKIGGWTPIQVENGTISMSSIARGVDHNRTYLLSPDAIAALLRKFKLNLKDDDGFLASLGKALDNKKRMVDIDTLPLVGDESILEVRKGLQPNTWYYPSKKSRLNDRYGEMKLDQTYGGGAYRFFGNAWDGSPYIFQKINEHEPLPLARFYNYTGPEQAGMMATETGFASTPNDIADEIEKITSFNDTSHRGEEARAQTLAKYAFLHRELSETEQMRLVNALSKHIIGSSGPRTVISPFALAFVDSHHLEGTPRDILLQRINHVLSKKDELNIVEPEKTAARRY